MINSLSLQKPLQWISFTLHLIWVFFPGILMWAVASLLFNSTNQGKDLIISLFQPNQSSWMLLPALLFWALVTWYSSRLISFSNFRKYYLPAKGLTHFPRLLGYHCISVIFTVIFNTCIPQVPAIHPILFFIAFTSLYLIWHQLMNQQLKASSPVILRNYNTGAFITALSISCWLTQSNDPLHWILLLPLLQLALLTLIFLRRNTLSPSLQTPENDIRNKLPKQLDRLMNLIFRDIPQPTSNSNQSIMADREKYFFVCFTFLCTLAVALYFAILSSVEIARAITPLPILLLGFGILLGAGNILSMLSFKLKMNFHFLVISAIIVAGYFNETHQVELIPLKKHLPHTERPPLRTHFNRWMAARSEELAQTQTNFPIYLILSDGGASRSAYWTASVLARIDSLMEENLYQHLFSLSGSSGGSLGNLSFLAAQQLPAIERTNAIQAYLSTDFLSYPLAYLLGMDFALPLIPGNLWSDRATALEKSLQETGSPIDSFMQSGFSALNPAADSSLTTPIIFLNCTRMQDGNPAALTNIRMDKKTFGQRIDVLRELKQEEDISVASSIVLGARFPYFSPAGRIRNNYFVDAGYMDNSGAGITHEMLMDLHALITDSLRKNPAHPYGKIRFKVLHITNDPASKPLPHKIHPLLNDLAAPILTLTGTHSRQTDFHNLRLKKYLEEIYGDENAYQVFNLYENGLEDSLPMNWTLSPKAVEKINKRLKNVRTPR